ncbi:MAG: hypothetical protein HZB56_06195 [Deltaproteobacteria bacterium]|nr:hypothetical protein [Deltaproteobacteria bacterium]
MQRVLLVAPSDQLARTITELAQGMDATLSTVREHAAAWKVLGEFGADRVIVDATTDRVRAYELVHRLVRMGQGRPTIVLVGAREDEEAFAVHGRLRRHADVYVTERADVTTMLVALASAAPLGPVRAGVAEAITGNLAALAFAAAALLAPARSSAARWLLGAALVAAWISALLWVRRLTSPAARAAAIGALLAITGAVIWAML